jgi:acyl dehydratase
MRIFNGFDDIKSAVGTEVGVSEWFEITQDRIDKFAEATCDEQWIHVDQDRAKLELPGGKTIAHGLLSLSLAPMFIRSVMGLKGLANTLNYGADRIRYLAPVPAGSRLRARTTIAEAEEVPPDGLGSATAWSSRSMAVSAPPASPNSLRSTCAEAIQSMI